MTSPLPVLRLIASAVYLFFVGVTLFLAFYPHKIFARSLLLVISILVQFLALCTYRPLLSNIMSAVSFSGVFYVHWNLKTDNICRLVLNKFYSICERCREEVLYDHLLCRLIRVNGKLCILFSYKMTSSSSSIEFKVSALCLTKLFGKGFLVQQLSFLCFSGV